MTDPEAAFQRFFEAHHADLSRLAYLLTSEPGAADDLAADAFVEIWRHWDRVVADGRRLRWSGFRVPSRPRWQSPRSSLWSPGCA